MLPHLGQGRVGGCEHKISSELKDKLVSRSIYLKYIFCDITNVSRVWPRSKAPESKTQMTSLRELL